MRPSRRVSSGSMPRSTTRSRQLSPEFANTVRESARERIGGLQSIAAEPRKARVTLVGNRWDTACLELRRFLVRNQITFDWLTPDDPRLAGALGGSPAGGERVARPSSQRGNDADQAAAEGTRRAPRPADETARRRIRHGDHRRRTGWPRRGRVRCFRGPAHPGRRARSAGRPGGDLITDRELSRLPRAASPATSWRAARSGRRGVSARRFW